MSRKGLPGDLAASVRAFEGRYSDRILDRYIYESVPPRPLEEVEAEIREVEREILEGLAELTGWVVAG